MAQKFGHYDSEYVLNKMPEYAEKVKELEALSVAYDKEVRSLYDEAERMRAELRATEVLLTSEMKKDRTKAIQAKQEEAAKKSTDLFGYNGLYFKKVDELLLPLRTKVNQTVEVVCKKYGLDYLFDKSADIGIAYSNPVHDYTEFVLEELGIIEQN
ncbi:OmpH family outer membrane protein [Roseivirga sp.]|uniref:OmpH family outer membrane protein n=1 Tax=Roseivirga sp. TaxID=1964215 RepID=UPI003BAB3923